MASVSVVSRLPTGFFSAAPYTPMRMRFWLMESIFFTSIQPRLRASQIR